MYCIIFVSVGFAVVALLIVGLLVVEYQTADTQLVATQLHRVVVKRRLKGRVFLRHLRGSGAGIALYNWPVKNVKKKSGTKIPQLHTSYPKIVCKSSSAHSDRSSVG